MEVEKERESLGLRVCFAHQSLVFPLIILGFLFVGFNLNLNRYWLADR
jgi:hypothetical protein